MCDPSPGGALVASVYELQHRKAAPGPRWHTEPHAEPAVGGPTDRPGDDAAPGSQSKRGLETPGRARLETASDGQHLAAASDASDTEARRPQRQRRLCWRWPECRTGTGGGSDECRRR